MDRRFLGYYETELRFLRDLAHEFASEHARVASRFGLEPDSCADPHVEWLLDGCAFLAARVQEKLDGEFERFTARLLEMVYPDYLAPTPSIALVRLEPDTTAGRLEDGLTVERGTQLVSRLGLTEQTRCTFTTAHPVTLWPITVGAVEYLTGSQVANAGVGLPPSAKAALKLTLKTQGGLPFRALALDRLVLHLASHDRLAHRLYEALLGNSMTLGSRGRPQVLGRERLAAVGFADDQALFPPAPTGFSGYRLLREYFACPPRFLFVELRDLQPAVRAQSGEQLELWVPFARADQTLEGSLRPEQLALFATPAINLFPRRAVPVVPEPHQREFHLIGDRQRPLDYEVFDVREVRGYGADEREVRRFERFYRTYDRTDPARDRAFFTLERRRRLVGSDETRRHRAARSSYLGSDVFLGLVDSTAAPWPGGLTRLDIDLLCTNRDLPLSLVLPPVGSHFDAQTGAPLASVRAIGKPTQPRPSLLTGDAPAGSDAAVSWRLVSHLALNYVSLLDAPAGGSGGDGAAALRALLRLYAETADGAAARQVEAVRHVRASPVVRRLPGPGPIVFGRGLEVGLEVAERHLPDAGAFLLGAVLEAFFRRYVSLNSFTETVLSSEERGELMRWPARVGERQLA